MNEMDRQDFLKFRELDDARWELIPDMESDDARTVRGAVERAGLLIARCLEDRDLASNAISTAWLSQLSGQRKQAVERMKEDPEWKLLDAVEGKSPN